MQVAVILTGIILYLYNLKEDCLQWSVWLVLLTIFLNLLHEFLSLVFGKWALNDKKGFVVVHDSFHLFPSHTLGVFL